MKQTPLSNIGSVLAVAIATLLATHSAQGLDGTWINASGGAWGTAGNWSPAIANGSGYTASFTMDLTGSGTVRVNAPRTIGNLIFSDSDPSTAFSWVLNNNANAANILTIATSVGSPTVTVGAMGVSKTATISAEIAGIQGLTKAGVGILVLSGTNTYSGGTIINAGELHVSNSSGLGASGNTTTLADAATLRLDGVTVAGQTAHISGNGFAGTGGGALSATGTSEWTGAVILDKNGSRIGGEANSVLTVSGKISSNTGISGLIVSPSETAVVVLSNAANDYLGSTTVSFGTLRLGATNTLPTGTALDVQKNALIAATLDLNGYSQEVAGLTRSSPSVLLTGSTITNNSATSDSTLTINQSGASTYRGIIQDGSSKKTLITKSGLGTLTLSGNNLYSGLTTISGGILQIGAGGTVGTLGSGGVTNNATLVFNRTDSYGGTVANAISGTGAVTLSGGTLTLSGDNLYIGGTTISGGKLLVSNTSGSGTGSGLVSVAGGASLGGTGTLGGDVSVSGTLAPGSSIGKLTVNGDVTLANNSTFAYEMDSGAGASLAGDLLIVKGGGIGPNSLSIGTNVELTLSGTGAFAPNTTLSLVQYEGQWNHGFFIYMGNELTNGETFPDAYGNQWTIRYDATAGGDNFVTSINDSHFISLTSIPEPGSLLALACLVGSGTFLRTRRRSFSVR